MRTRNLAAILLLVPALAGANEYYKWLDPDGHVHYSQDPPKVGEFTKVDLAEPPPGLETSNPGVAALHAYTVKKDQEREEAAKEAQKKKEFAAANNEVCKQAQRRQRELSQIPPNRLRVVDDTEEGHRMTDEEYADEQARLEQLMKDTCQ